MQIVYGRWSKGQCARTRWFESWLGVCVVSLAVASYTELKIAVHCLRLEISPTPKPCDLCSLNRGSTRHITIRLVLAYINPHNSLL